MQRSLLVTGSSGLIGSEVCVWFHRQGWKVHGLDNNQRAVFFGPQGDTRWNQSRLQREIPDLCIMNWICATARAYWIC
jgi:CDP-paratose 2-epimerase